MAYKYYINIQKASLPLEGMGQVNFYVNGIEGATVYKINEDNLESFMKSCEPVWEIDEIFYTHVLNYNNKNK